MARKTRKRGSWIPTILFYLLFPPVVWFLAFMLWFYWYDLERAFFTPKEKPKQSPGQGESRHEKPKQSPAQSETKLEKRVAPPLPATEDAQEKILDDDRKKLDAIIKRLKQRKSGDDRP